ncbi:MAG: tRNA 2-thiouridine(34) synthase MnmA [Bacteroidales bacterium]
MKRGRILVGMSGGVDSSACCILLQEQGYEVVGATLRMWDSGKTDFEPPFIQEARALATKLGIEHYTVDIRKEFMPGVIQPFIDEYMHGRTPNPCVICNPGFKWRYLLETADKYNCLKVATGHYVRIAEKEDIYWIEEGEDKNKDQSYFLWGLTQRELSRTIFPLGGYRKSDIKDEMMRRGFPEKAAKRESMEICFIKNDYRSFLREMIPNINERVAGGYFVDSSGRKLGYHNGYPFYTVGQRKGLEIALGHPAYVVKINPYKNTVKLGSMEDLICSAMTLEKCIFADESILDSPDIRVRVRYRGKAIKIKCFIKETDKLTVEFGEVATSIAPGQSAVFYIGERVVGGGIIANTTAKSK